MQKQKKPYPTLYRAVRWLIKTIYPKTRVFGTENLPDEPVIIVGNHTQLHGPIISEIHLPFPRRIWCAGQMMNLREVPEYAFSDFWSQKPKYQHPFFRLLSYLIAPLSVLIFNNARTIAVHRDARIISTFKETVACLKNGESIVIFPEHDVKYNNIVYEFQENFIDVARLYYKKTGHELSFVPMYVAPKLHEVHLGTPVRFDSKKDISDERKRLCRQLTDAITDIAVNLPPHTVVPYRNIPKKLYPLNKPLEDTDNENANC